MEQLSSETEQKDYIQRITLNDTQYILIGTAHVSAESVEDVKNILNEELPDTVCVELDKGRLSTMTNKKAWQEMDINQVLRQRKGFLLFANLVLSAFQKKISGETGVQPGAEMKAAIDLCKEKSLPYVLADREIAVTLRRAWSKSSLWQKNKLLALLLSTMFTDEDISAEDIEKLKQQNELDTMMGEMAKELPTVKEVLIDERDQYLAGKIYNASGLRVAAVIGAGHMPGVVKWLKKLEAKEVSVDLEEISHVPPPGFFSKIIPWIVPVLILTILGLGFVFGGVEAFAQMTGFWFWINASLSAIGTILALGHPLSILVSFVAAPITSLIPVVGSGMVAALVQGWVRKPKVADFEALKTDAESIRGFYRNRVTKVLLVMILSSLGSAIGTFIGGTGLITDLIKLFS
jgi:pheromone shutdown-related protein TraB